MSATVILPTTGSPDLKKAIESVLSQSYQTECYVAVDGIEYWDKVKEIVKDFTSDRLKVYYLPVNTGGGGYYGQRIMSALVHFVNTEYTLFLDQDCWFDDHHVLSMVETITNNNLDWCYSLRKIVDQEGNYLFDDNCESLGKWNPVVDYKLVDNNCYCLPKNLAIQLSVVFHGGWGQDRVLYNVLEQNFKNFDCTGKYTLNYRLGGNAGSVPHNFFINANATSAQIHKGQYPWVK